MKVSEKTLELNIGAELLWWLRAKPGFRKLYLRGLTQREERQEGVDFFAQLNPKAKIFAFQFKAPKGSTECAPYKFTLVAHQHHALHTLAVKKPSAVFYVFPFYISTTKLQKHSPTLLSDTWFLDVKKMSPRATLFKSRKTLTLSGYPGKATINPEYEMMRFGDNVEFNGDGLSPEEFANWYAEFRSVQSENSVDPNGKMKRRDPWLARGLRIAIAIP